MEENYRIKYTSYLCGAVEHVSSKEMKNWREEVKETLGSPDLVFYDPIERESQKTGKPAREHISYVQGLKQAGLYDKFDEEMDKIWFGRIDTSKIDLIRLLIYLNEKSKLEGNYINDLDYWGDMEAVARSNFIIVYLPKEIKTVGSYFEVRDAYLLGIPIYLILPNHPKTEANSSLLHVIRKNGEIFYSIKECCDYVKTHYKLKEISEKQK